MDDISQYIVFIASIRAVWATYYSYLVVPEAIGLKLERTKLATWLYREHISKVVYVCIAAGIFLYTAISGAGTILGIPSFLYYVIAELVFVIPTIARKTGL